MFVGLAVTAMVGAVVAGSPAATQAVASNHLLFLAALVIELALAVYPSARVESLTLPAASVLFLVYSMAGFTAWDAQPSRTWPPTFINLFLMLLQFTGGRRA